MMTVIYTIQYSTNYRRETKMNEKLKKGLALGTAVIIGGAGVAVIDTPEPIDTSELELALTALNESNFAYEELLLTYGNVLIKLEDLEVEFAEFLEDFDDIIEEQEAEDEALALAKEEILEDTRDLEDYLEEEFGWDIGDDDDIVLSFLGDVEVLKSDFEDERYTFVFEHVKVTYDEDDEDYKEYIDIKVKVKEGEVVDIDYMEA